MQISEIRRLIQQVYSLDKTPYSNRNIVDEIDKKLDTLSNGEVRIRWWKLEDKLYCTPIYSDSLLRDKIEGGYQNE